MRAFIYVGGSIAPENITEHPKSGDLTIAADSGLHNAKKLGERIDIVLGDLDSVGKFTLPDGAEQITFPPEKDLTDAQLAEYTANRTNEHGDRNYFYVFDASGLPARATYVITDPYHY